MSISTTVLSETQEVSADGSMLGRALYLVRYGFRVFPLCARPGHDTCFKQGCSDKNAGKHPLLMGWTRDATTVETKIHEWWTKYSHANIGIATGRGLFVLDVDPRHGGDVSLDDLEHKRGKLPETVTVLTGGGGEHRYFLVPDGVKISNSTAKIGVGLDIRGDGGYVVAPGSLHTSGRRYEFEVSSGPDVMSIAWAPNWFVDLATKANKQKTKQDRVSKKPKGCSHLPVIIPDGIRNDTLLNEACVYRDHGFSYEHTLTVLRALSAQYCKPPLTDIEIFARVNSAYRRPKRLTRKPVPSVQAQTVYKYLFGECVWQDGIGRIERSYSEISVAVSISRTAAKRAIKNLEWHRWMDVEKNGNPTARNTYILQSPALTQRTPATGYMLGTGANSSFFLTKVLVPKYQVQRNNR
ncbi:MAG: bifunctional DNA primase/polymerase [Thermodesulfobacteriota bacterium]